jgi:hypothetical protein
MGSTVPCATCPWRRTSTVGGADIPGFDLDLMRGLACTVGDGDDFRQVMACHYSPDTAMTTCVGYAAQHGYSNLNVRIMAANGDLDLPAIADACADLDLWPDFDTMLAAYEAASDGSTPGP